MKSDEEILKDAISGGLIGATLSALISGSKDGSGTGAIAGAVLLASIKANERAKKTSIPVLIEENGKLYELYNGGNKKFIRSLPKRIVRLPKTFTLK